MSHSFAAHWSGLVVRLAIVAAACSWPAGAEEEVWIAPAGGLWSGAANWADGMAPAAGGSATLTVRFPTVGATSTTTTHDLNDGFLVNQLLFTQAAGEALTLSSVTSRRLTLSGALSRIAQDGAGEVTITAPLALDPADFVTTIDGKGDLAIASDITGTGSLMKAGAGTLTLSAPAAFSGTLSIRGGTFALTGAGAVQSPDVMIQNGAILHLDATASAGARLPANQSVSMLQGELRIAGDATVASTVRIGTLDGAGSTLRLEPRGAQPLTLQFGTIVYPNTDILVRAEGLGGPSGTTFTRVVADTPLAGPGGLVFGMYAAGLNELGGERFTIYDSSSDAAGTIGLQALPLAAYTPASIIENPATPAEAHVLVQGAATTVGERNVVRTLTFEPGASLTQAATQTLSVSGGRVMVRSGGAPVTVSGGALELGERFGSFIAFGDLVLDAPVIGTEQWAKFGPGMLTLGAQPAGAGRIRMGSGPFRPLTADALALNIIEVDAESAVLEMGGNPAVIGALDGRGTIRFGGGALTVGTAGTDFWFAGSFADNGEVIIVDGGDPHATRTVQRWSGPGQPRITLASGLLRYSDRDVKNPTPLTLAGGILESIGGSVPLIVTGDAVIRANAVLSGSPAAISGPGNLRIEPLGGFVIVRPDTHSGTTTIRGGGLILEGTDGMLSSTSSVRVENGSLNVWYGYSSAGRLNDAAPIHLSGGKLVATAPHDGTAIEVTGTLYAGPRSAIDLASSQLLPATSVVELRMPRIEREDGGVLAINATRLIEPTAPKHVSIHVAEPPAMIGGGASAGAGTSIVPWIVAYEGDQYSPGPFSLATYDPRRGFRALDPAADFAQGVAAVTAPTNNLRVSGLETLTAPLVVNSLVLSDHLAPPRMEGAAALTVTSGMILSSSPSTSTIAAPLAFGSAEAILHAASGDVEISSEISGSGGLTKAGARTVTLSGNNSFTGPLRILDGTLRYVSNTALGNDRAAIELHGGTLAYAGTNSATLDRPIALGTGGGTVSNGAGALLAVTGPISGPGGLTIGGGTVLLTGTNSYSGETTIAAGTVRFTSDAALGSGALRMNGGLLEPMADWTTNRDVYLSRTAGAVSTGGYEVTWNGALLEYGTLSKRGAGRLIVKNTEHFSGNIEVLEGTLELPRSEAHNSNFTDAVSVSAGATLAGKGWLGSSLWSLGTIEPGPGIGTISASRMEVAGASSQAAALALEIASPTSFDRITADYGFTLSGQPELAITLTYDPVDGVDSFRLISNGFYGPMTGHFYSRGVELREGALFSVGSQPMRLSYIGGYGHDLVLYAVPEPCVGLLVLTALPYLRRRRRRH